MKWRFKFTQPTRGILAEIFGHKLTDWDKDIKNNTTNNINTRHSASNVCCAQDFDKYTKSRYSDLRIIMKVNSKFNKSVFFGKGVTQIGGGKGRGGGSNNYPYPYFESGYCILEIEGITKPDFSFYHPYKWIIEELT